MGLLEILEICLATSRSTEVFVNTWKNILKLWGFCRALEILEYCLATSGSTGGFVNCLKDILKLWGFCRASRNSRKMFSNFRKYWSVCKCLKNVLKLWGFCRAIAAIALRQKKLHSWRKKREKNVCPLWGLNPQPSAIQTLALYQLSYQPYW